MRLTKSLGMAGALIAAALVGGTLISTALATDADLGGNGTPTQATDTERIARCEIFLDAFAAELDATPDEVIAAGKAGANAVIDAAVAAGNMSEERAERLRERIANADGDGCGLFRAVWVRGFGHGAIHGWLHGIVGGDAMEAAASALGIDSADLIARLRDAGSLESVAADLGADYEAIKASVVAAIQADLDATEMPDERKAAILDRVSEWLDAGGKVGRPHPGHGHHGHGPGGPGDAGA